MTCKISKRELEILQLISQEHSTNEIAQMLYISPSTVESHRRNLRTKMKVKNVAGLIREAFYRQLLVV